LSRNFFSATTSNKNKNYLRGNIIIEGTEPFSEEDWDFIEIPGIRKNLK